MKSEKTNDDRPVILPCGRTPFHYKYLGILQSIVYFLSYQSCCEKYLPCFLVYKALN